jgi:hypothetical protein
VSSRRAVVSQPRRISSRRLRTKVDEAVAGKRQTRWVPLKVPGRSTVRRPKLQRRPSNARRGGARTFVRNVPRPLRNRAADGDDDGRSHAVSSRRLRHAKLGASIARRRHERVLVDMDIKVFYQFLLPGRRAAESLLFRGTLLDISPAGMGLIGAMHPAVHEDDVEQACIRVVMHLTLPLIERELTLVGRLRHLRSGHDARDWHYGMSFENLAPHTELAIRRFLMLLHQHSTPEMRLAG